jgi:hypothetical protein
MKTLKKALALVLALALCLSLATVAFAANYDSYADASDVTDDYAEAVDLVVGLGIITGKDGNKLDLSGTLTRAEAAKILTVMNLGTKLAETINSSSADTGFSDTKGNWASGYIAYNASKGYLTGSNGKFSPNAELTGTAFGKMLLNVLGYGLTTNYVTNETTNNYEGSSWAINVLVDGNKIGLFNGVKSDVNGAITRADAMQMVYNALAVYSTAKVDVAGYYELSSEFEYQTATGIVAMNSSNSPNEYTTVAVITSDDNGKVSALNAKKFAVDTDSDALGTVVTIKYKNAAAQPDEGYTVYTVDTVSTAVTVANDISNNATKMAAAFGADTDVAAAVRGFSSSYAVVTNITAAGFVKNTSANAGTYYIYNGEVVSYVAPITYTLEKVTAYTAPTEKANGSVTITGVKADGTAGETNAITLQKIGSETADVIKLYDGIAAGDYVYFQKFGTAVGSVSKATVVTNVTVSAYTASKSLTADKTYDLSSVSAGDSGVTPVSTAPTLGTTAYNLVLDKAGAVIGYETYTATSNANQYAYILAIGNKDGQAANITNGYKAVDATVSVLVMKADGTTETLTYTVEGQASGSTAQGALDTASGKQGSALATGDVIKYAADDGVLTEATYVAEDSNYSTAAITAGTAKVVDGKYLTASTPIVYIANAGTPATASGTVITGYAKTQAATAANAYFVIDNGTIVVVFVNGAYSTTTTATNIAYSAAVTSTSYSTTKYDTDLKATVYGYTVYVDGVETTLWAKSGSLSSLTADAGYIEYTLTDGYLTGVSNTVSGYSTASGTVNFIDGTTIAIGSSEYTYANAQIISVENNVATVGGTLAKDQTVTALVKDGAVVYIAISVA